MTSVSTEKARRPVNIAAERAVIAGIIQYGNKIHADVAQLLNNDCFTVSDNLMLYDISKKILQDSDTVDMPSILSTGTVMGYGDIISKREVADYIKAMFNFSINIENVKTNSVIIRKLQAIRLGQDKAKDVYYNLSKLNGTESFTEIISNIESPILNTNFGVGESEDVTIKLSDCADDSLDYFENLDGKTIGVPSPFSRYNECIGGGRRPGYVYLIAARPKSGKTQMGIFDALHACFTLKIPVLYIDTEMKKIDLMARVYASMTGVPFKVIETGSFKHNHLARNKLYEARQKIRNSEYFSYHRVAGKPFDEILSIIRKWVINDVGLVNGKANPCLVIYDYFKLMDASDLDKMQEYQALGFQIGDLSNFCGKYEIPCSAFVQQNRDGVDKTTSDTLSQSDRLLWLCASLAILKRKTDEEIIFDGPENGNVKLVPTSDQRFGPGLSDGDWINLNVQYDRCIFTEGMTRKELAKNKNKDSGFEVVETESDGFSDDDFDKAEYRDNEYNKS